MSQSGGGGRAGAGGRSERAGWPARVWGGAWSRVVAAVQGGRSLALGKTNPQLCKSLQVCIVVLANANGQSQSSPSISSFCSPKRKCNFLLRAEKGPWQSIRAG